MNRTSTVTSNSSGNATDTSAGTSTWDTARCRASVPIPTIPYAGISASFSDTRDKFRAILKKPLRGLWIQYEEAGEGGTGVELEREARQRSGSLSEGRLTCPKRLSQRLSTIMGASSNAEKSPDDSPIRFRKDSITVMASDVKTTSQETTGDNQPADFVDLHDPFACYTAGYPQIVKDPASALPHVQTAVTNKVIVARRRVRRVSERPVSAGRRPTSAGKRPSSAGSHSGGRARFEWKVGASTAADRIARLRPSTPKKPSVPKVEGTAPRVLSSLLNTKPLPPIPSSASGSLELRPFPSSATSPKRLQKSKSPTTLPHRAPRPSTPNRATRTPPTSQAPRTPRARKPSFNLRDYLPFMLQPTTNAIVSSPLTSSSLPPTLPINPERPSLPTSCPLMRQTSSSTPIQQIAPTPLRNGSSMAARESRRLSYILPPLTVPTLMDEG